MAEMGAFFQVPATPRAPARGKCLLVLALTMVLSRLNKHWYGAAAGLTPSARKRPRDRHKYPLGTMLQNMKKEHFFVKYFQ
jgi:hypothetical protein